MDRATNLNTKRTSRNDNKTYREETLKATIETENSEYQKPHSQYNSRRQRLKPPRIRTETATLDQPFEPLTNKAIKCKLLGYRDRSLIQELFRAGVATPTNFPSEQLYTDKQHCSYNKRTPLLFMRPYSKYSSNRKTLEEVKKELYSTVKKGYLFNETANQPIEYFTEYGDNEIRAPSTDSSQKPKPKLSLACRIYRQKVETNRQARAQSQNTTSERKLGTFYMNNFLSLL